MDRSTSNTMRPPPRPGRRNQSNRWPQSSQQRRSTQQPLTAQQALSAQQRRPAQQQRQVQQPQSVQQQQLVQQPQPSQYDRSFQQPLTARHALAIQQRWPPPQPIAAPVHLPAQRPRVNQRSQPRQPYPGPPIYPLSIDEAVRYTSTRRPPPNALPANYQYHFISVFQPRLHYPSLFRPQLFSCERGRNARIPIEPAVDPLYDPTHDAANETQTHILADPTPPPYYPPPRSRNLSSPVRKQLGNQRVYAMVYHSLDRNDGWIWWEKDYMDIDKLVEDFCEKEDKVDEDGDADMQGDLGEEEEVVTEAEKIRVEKYKKIAKKVAEELRKGVVD